MMVALAAVLFMNKPSAEQSLLMRNVEAIARGEGDYEGYRNVGHYVVTRAGEGSGSLSPDEWAKFEMTSDVILVTYYNDCESKRRKQCYESLRTIPPVIIYQQQ